MNSVQRYWSDVFANGPVDYEAAKTVLFTGQTASGCATASTASGPFYRPADAKVSPGSPGFFDQLRTKFGARGGPFAQAYVIAHEYGHHVQDPVRHERSDRH